MMSLLFAIKGFNDCNITLIFKNNIPRQSKKFDGHHLIDADQR